MKIEISFIFEI